MAIRFRKRLKIIPGVWLNLSKSGVSTSVGIKGLTVNMKDGKARTTASIPGTGLSYSTTSSVNTGSPSAAKTPLLVPIILVVTVVIFLLI